MDPLLLAFAVFVGVTGLVGAVSFLVIKGGVFEGQAMSADEIRKLADLESRDVMLAKLAGAMKANLSKAAATFQAPLTQLARLAQALQEKQSGGSEAAADAAE